jgi:hypothetical protein
MIANYNSRKAADPAPFSASPGTARPGMSTAAMAYTAALNSTTSFIPMTSPTSAISGSIDSPIGGQTLQNGTIPHQRRLALSLCGWNFIQQHGLEEELAHLQSSSQPEKAAALALLHSDVHRWFIFVKCILIFQRTNITGVQQYFNIVGALINFLDENYKMLATVVAGFGLGHSQDSNAVEIWQDLCRSVADDFRQPYLRAMLKFIGSHGDYRSLASLVESRHFKRQ